MQYTKNAQRRSGRRESKMSSARSKWGLLAEWPALLGLGIREHVIPWRASHFFQDLFRCAEIGNSVIKADVKTRKR